MGLDRFVPPLRWMLYEGLAHGLLVKPLQITKWEGPEHHPSMNRFWRLLEYLPITRLSYDTSRTSEHTVTW